MSTTFKQRIDTLRLEKARMETRLETAQAELKEAKAELKKLGFKTVNEATEYVAKMDEELNSKLTEMEQALGIS